VKVYISFLKRQHNVMLFYINGQEMERYIHFWRTYSKTTHSL